MDARTKTLKLLEDIGMSRSALARELGCDPSFINLVLAGKRRMVGAFAFKLEDFAKRKNKNIDARDWVRDLL